jgi:iron complex transport system substrate-binding protein
VFAGDLAKNAIWTNLPFAAEGRLHKLAPGTWTFGGPKSVERIADQLVDGVTG